MIIMVLSDRPNTLARFSHTSIISLAIFMMSSLFTDSKGSLVPKIKYQVGTTVVHQNASTTLN